jgi:hypothetical protein
LRLRALDASGRLLREVGLAVTRSSEATDAGAFIVPVPPSARVVELVRDGQVLHRLARTQTPRVRLLTLRRGTRARTRLTLAMRWRAADPDGGGLLATVEYSDDGSRRGGQSTRVRAAVWRESPDATWRPAGAGAGASRSATASTRGARALHVSGRTAGPRSCG